MTSRAGFISRPAFACNEYPPFLSCAIIRSPKLSEEDRMEHKHLDAAALEHLLTADRTAQQNEQLFHLLAVCPRCRVVGGWVLELHPANALPPVFGLLDA